MSSDSPIELKYNTSTRVVVDWLTITTQEAFATQAMINKLFELLPEGFLQKERQYKWGLQGYKGFAYEGIRYGLRGSEGIVMLSGQRCGELWWALAPSRHRCTRIDLAVTVTLKKQFKNFIAKSYKLLQDENNGIYGSVVHNTQGGGTLYVGRRAGEIMGRLYDKGSEQGEEPGYIFRYEVETKKPKSESLLVELLKTKDVPAMAAAFVYDFFMARGVIPVFPRSDALYAIETQARVSDRDKTLTWLAAQVAPAVKRLIINGDEAAVRDALGLPTTTIKQRIEQQEW